MPTSSAAERRRDAPVPITPLVGRSWIAADVPIPPTPFVGREREVGAVCALLGREDVRLVTLTGPGGAGKSRLALEVATRVVGEFADGAVFVPLVTVSDPGDVERAIAQAVGLHGANETCFGERLSAVLSDAECLLLLDNFEHVAAAAPVLAPILASCRGLKMVVTSRTALRLASEHVYVVPPLSLSEPNAALAVGSLAGSDAVRLFAMRASAVAPDFRLTAATVPLVVEICRRLDGLPLAIELAAARVSHLALSTLLDRLEHRLPLLTGGGRDQPRRHQTMRDAIAWSYDLLGDDDRALFRRLAVFAGGFTFDAAEYVIDGQTDRRADGQHDETPLSVCPSVRLPVSVVDGLASMIDGSLLRYDAGTARYGWLETIREYAIGQLETSGEEELARNAHAAYFLAYAERYELAEIAPPGDHAVARLQEELPNLRAALVWLDEQGKAESLLQLAGALGRFWSAQGLYREGGEWIERALARAEGLPIAVQARAVVGLGMTALFQGERDLALSCYREGLALCRHAGDALNAAQALIGLGSLELQIGDVDGAEASLDEAVKVAESIQDPRLATIMTGRGYANLGIAARSRRDLELAVVRHEEALRRFRAAEYSHGIVLSVGDLGEVAREGGDYARALALYREVLELNRESGSPRVVHHALNVSAIAVAALGRAEQAARWFGAADVVRERTGLGYLVPVDRTFQERGIVAARTALGDTAFSSAWAAGRALTVDQAVAEVLDTAEDAPVPTSSAPLTPRERDVLRLIVAGYTDREIAETLFIGVRTVETHILHSYTKLGVRSRAAAAAAVVAAGLVPKPAPTGNQH